MPFLTYKKIFDHHQDKSMTKIEIEICSLLFLWKNKQVENLAHGNLGTWS